VEIERPFKEMTMRQTRLLAGSARLAMPAVLLALLAACGGGAGGRDEPPSASALEVPASATASTQAYVQFASDLLTSETAAPLAMAATLLPPTSEIEEPLRLR